MRKYVLLRAGSAVGQVICTPDELPCNNPEGLDAVEVAEFGDLATQTFDGRKFRDDTAKKTKRAKSAKAVNLTPEEIVDFMEEVRGRLAALEKGK
jgi:hypothetical protein